MSDWLELELADRLAPTEAPDALWLAVERGRAMPPQPARRPIWPIAAIVTLMAAAGVLWMTAKGQEPALDLQRLAALERDGTQPLGIRSSDPVEVAAWLKRQAGVEIRLAPAAEVHLAGARVIRQRGARVAAVAFTVQDHPATLLIARTASRTMPHAGLEWALSQGEPELACLLCHSSL